MTAKKGIDLGPIGTVVARNVERIRGDQNLSYAELSRRLDEHGRPIAPLGLTRIRDGKRRVDVDDLVALSLALGVSPTTLLLPHSDTSTVPAADRKASVTDGGEEYPLSQIWRWLVAESPIDVAPAYPSPPSAVEFQLKARPDAVTADPVPLDLEGLNLMMNTMQLAMKNARLTISGGAQRGKDHLDRNY